MRSYGLKKLSRLFFIFPQTVWFKNRKRVYGMNSLGGGSVHMPKEKDVEDEDDDDWEDEEEDDDEGEGGDGE